MAQYPPSGPPGYPATSPGYPATSPGYPATSPGYPPNQGGFPPGSPAHPTGAYPQNTGGYPQNTGGYQPNTGGYPPNAGGYPQTSPSYPPNTGGYPQTSPSYPPNATGYPPNQAYQNAQNPQNDFHGARGGISPNQGPPPPGPPPPGGFPPTDKLQLDGEPGAPPLSELANLPGYEGITFDNSALKPPTYDESVATPNVPREIFQNAPSLTEDEAREALIQYVSEHCCYGSKAAKQMTIKDIRFNSAIHYKLETYGEKRETAWAFEPFKGQNLPVQVGGYSPGPWEIEVHKELGNFHDMVKIVEVPNTTTLRPCHKCLAMGRVRCKHCQGNGSKHCTWCNGRGVRTQFEKTEQCHSCNGSGHDRCTWCEGHGQVTCDVCKGHTQLRYYIKMTVTWKNHVGDSITDTADLPKELIRTVSGQTAFEDEQPRVWPISNFPDAAVNSASQELVGRHKTAFPQERILMQRQQVRIVPIANIDYIWKSKEGKYFVYGFENKVHFPEYPQSCCCGCQII